MNDTTTLALARKFEARYARVEISGLKGARVLTVGDEMGPFVPDTRRYIGSERPLLYEPYGNPPTVGAEA